DRYFPDLGAGHVPDRDLVRAGQGLDDNGFDVIDIHHDAADVPDQKRPATVGRQGDILRCAGAVESQGIVTVLSLDDIAAITWIPGEHVAARAEEGRVIPLIAVDVVIAVAAE